jgi:hypothetical protein
MLAACLIAACAGCAALVVQGGLAAERLRCEEFVDPLGVDVARPRLSWQVETTVPARQNQSQSAYRVLAATTRAQLDADQGDLWDSGEVASHETLNVVWGGKPLTTHQEVLWKVRVWDETRQPSGWSAPARFVAGVMNARDWTGQWISAFPKDRVPVGIGYHAALIEEPELADPEAPREQKWVAVDLGEWRPVERVTLVPVRGHLGCPVFGFPLRFVVEASDDVEFESCKVLLDHAKSDFDVATLAAVATGGVDPPPRDFTFSVNGAAARFVRVRALKPWRDAGQRGCFALAELIVESGGVNAARGAPVVAKDSLEQSGWHAAALTDGAVELQDHATTLLRKEFSVARPLRRAIAEVCGLGQYELFLDGARVGDEWLTPQWTQYSKSCLYDTREWRDATLPPGRHCLALRLGNGPYDMRRDLRGAQQNNSSGSPKALLQLELEFADGTRETVATDATWRQHAGGETYSGFFGGEDFDARREPAQWAEPGFDDSTWGHAVRVAAPPARLAGLSRAAPPVREIETRVPKRFTEPKPGVVVVDLEQNAPWVPELTVEAAAGTTVRMRPGEILGADGTVDQSTMRPGKLASYTCRGGSPKGPHESWRPAFWYCGARYWQFEATDPAGASIDPKSVLVSLRFHMIHSSSTPVGEFACSNELFDKTRKLIVWALRSNMVSTFTDCPHREKSGWLEQVQLCAPGIAFEYDLAPLFRKTICDIDDAQLGGGPDAGPDAGMVPTTAPEYFIYEDGFRHSVEWGCTAFLLPKYTRQWYGVDLLATVPTHYATLQRYADFLAKRAPDGIVDGGLGDWDGDFNQRTPIPLTGTAYWYASLNAMTGFAQQLERSGDVARYRELAAKVRAAFNAKFLDEKTGRYATGSQAAQAIALDLGLVPDGQREAAFARLLEDVAAGDYAVNCGEIGHPSLLRALAEAGRSDVVFKIHSTRGRPGYAYHLEKGETTLTETWNCSNISHNHFMLGHILEWFWQHVAGLRPDPDGSGFSHFTVAPDAFVGDLTWARAEHESPRGTIEVEWKREGETVHLKLLVPPNTTATVLLPSSAPRNVGSGHYEFDSSVK